MTKVILITGATSGIGKATAEYLSEKGFKVYGTGRQPSTTAGKAYQILQMDVTDAGSIQNGVAHILEKEGRIDVLINNAGVGATGSVEDTPTEDMRKLFDTNLFGAIDVIKAVLPSMRARRMGMIINVTSIAGYIGLPFRGVYSSSKAALETVTEALSIEVKPFNIKIATIAPGDFATDIASRRYHTPVSETSVYKASYQQILEAINQNVSLGRSPVVMAKAIHNIISDNRPKLHYKEGRFMEKLSVALKRILPDRLFEKMVARHYKL